MVNVGLGGMKGRLDRLELGREEFWGFCLVFIEEILEFRLLFEFVFKGFFFGKFCRDFIFLIKLFDIVFFFWIFCLGVFLRWKLLGCKDLSIVLELFVWFRGRDLLLSFWFIDVLWVRGFGLRFCMFRYCLWCYVWDWGIRFGIVFWLEYWWGLLYIVFDTFWWGIFVFGWGLFMWLSLELWVGCWLYLRVCEFFGGLVELG